MKLNVRCFWWSFDKEVAAAWSERSNSSNERRMEKDNKRPKEPFVFRYGRDLRLVCFDVDVNFLRELSEWQLMRSSLLLQLVVVEASAPAKIITDEESINCVMMMLSVHSANHAAINSINTSKFIHHLALWTINLFRAKTKNELKSQLNAQNAENNFFSSRASS